MTDAARTADGPSLYAHRGTRAIQRMVEFAPSTGGLALWVRHQDVPAGSGAAPIATDGDTIFYGPAFEGLKPAVQAGLVAHEVLHIALRHPQRLQALGSLVGDVDLQLFNICADAIVNSTLGHLSWLRLPDSAVTLEKLLSVALSISQPVEKSLLEWDVERVYRAIDDRRVGARGGSTTQSRHQRGGGKGASEDGSGAASEQSSRQEQRRDGTREDGPRAAKVRALGADAVQDLRRGAEARVAPEREADEARTWSERIVRAHAGDGEHSLLRTLLADVPHTRTPWEQVLRVQLAHSLAPQPGISWSRPARSWIANQGRSPSGRRLPWTPGTSASRAVPHLVLIIDVSGSIEDELMQRFAREIRSISRRLEAALVLIVGDDRVRSVQRFEPGQVDLEGIACQGGGGTDFTPLLEEAGRHAPDIVVVLTDLDGPAGIRPRFPVIWAVPEACVHAVAPFGRKLALS
jgi:predicted metal-dependent peptidase